eukprot:scaffold42680_cov18-Prasinocladus_malaysianus.AAC.1
MLIVSLHVYKSSSSSLVSCGFGFASSIAMRFTRVARETDLPHLVKLTVYASAGSCYGNTH